MNTITRGSNTRVGWLIPLVALFIILYNSIFSVRAFKGKKKWLRFFFYTYYEININISRKKFHRPNVASAIDNNATTTISILLIIHFITLQK